MSKQATKRTLRITLPEHPEAIGRWSPEKRGWLVEYFSDDTAEDSYVGGASVCDTEQEALQLATHLRGEGWTVSEPKPTVYR